MSIEEALKWADTFGSIQSDPPTGDGPALLTLAKEVRRLRSGSVVGRCVEAGNDDAGQPRLLIHTTREELLRFGRNLVFSEVEVRVKEGSAA